MKLGVVALVSKQSANDYNEQFCSFLRYVVDEGFSVEFFTVMNINTDITSLVSSYTEKTDALIFFGGDDFVRAGLGIMPGEYISSVNNKFFVVLPDDENWSESFANLILPHLTTAPKAVYDEIIIKTFGLLEIEVRERLREFMGFRKRLTIELRPSILECDVVIKYSSKIPKYDFDYCVQGCISALNDAVYGVGNTSLSECIVHELAEKGGKLAVAESFTGGAIASSLVKVAGASGVLTEGIVAYTNNAKIARLNVDPRILERHGSVSNETAYYMATGLFNMNNDIHYVCATTGYAGPNDKDTGLCYIATGDRDNIHLRKYNFEGTREEIIEYGKKRALMDLLWLIRKI